MPVFELQHPDGKTYEVDAPDMQAAAAGMAEHRTSSATDAFGRGMMKGATFNFYDELTGLAKAGGLAEGDPDVAHAIKSLAVGSYKKLRGDEDAQKNYDEQVARTRASSKQMQAEHPAATMAGEVTGAAALPVGGMLRAGTMPARMLRGAGLGAVTGAAAGAGEGEDPADRATRAGMGAVTGGAVGAVAPPVVEGLVQGARAVAAPVVNAVRGAFRPGDEAARRVVGAIERDITNDPAAAQRLTPQEFNASRLQPGGGPATVMDMGGETTRALARSAANTSPEGRQTINTAIDQRFEGQTGRVSDWLRQTFHYPDAQAQQQAIEQTARTVNRAAYARAHRDPGAQAMWDEGFEQLMQAPVVQDAARGATRTGANQAATQGFTPVRNPFEFHDTGSLTPRYTQRIDDQGRTILPNLGFWDHVKRNLDDQISKLQRSGENSAARDAQQLRTALVSHLDELVPTYQEARAGAAHFFGAENALEAGQNFVGASSRYGIPAARDAMARMSAQERQLFQDGYVSRLVEKIEATGDRRNVVNQVMTSPAARAEIRLALGPGRSTELEAQLRVEGIMDLARRAVQGNSTTARQLAELGLAGGGGALGIHGGVTQDPREMTVAALMGALAMGGRHIDQRVARRVAEMLVSDDPGVLRRGVQVIARNNQFLNALRSADQRLARIGGQQSTNIPVLQTRGSGRGDEQQPNVPRP